MGEGEGGLSMPSDHSMWGGGSLNVGTPPPPRSCVEIEWAKGDGIPRWGL